ncbi:MAG: type II toxin-antitoxin system HicB family antitoxin [Euryarchaeota archaeon]|nr:type II toxin-antitoxin system HicB family antitoxin [Euryarchaeota archaeon]
MGHYSRYVHAAMKKARYEILPDDGTFYAEIPGFDGVYANRDNLGSCRGELEGVLEEWVLLRVHLSLPLPVIDGIGLSIMAAV